MRERWGWRDLAARPWFFPSLLLALGAVLGSGVRLSTGPVAAIFLGLFGVFAAVSLALGARTGSHLALLTALGWLGAGLAALEARVQVPDGLPPGGLLHLEGELESVEPVPDGARALLAVAHIEEAGAAQVRFRTVLFLHGSGSELSAGQRVRVTARLKALNDANNWGEWDGKPLALQRAVRFHANAEKSQVVPLSAPSGFARWLTHARASVAEHAARVAPSPESAALYATLAAGLRAELPEVWEERFARSGLAHVLSVSGMHVAALALVVLFGLRFVLARFTTWSRTHDVRRAAAALAVPALWSYVLFTGLQAPAVRSALMLSVLLTANVLWRRADALNSLSLAAFVLVAFAPSSVLDLSLQLSFLAVLSLVLLAPALRAMVPIEKPHPQERSKLRRALGTLRETLIESVCASVAVTLFSVPLVASAFHRLSLAGIAANILCLPLGGALSALSAAGAFLECVTPTLAAPVIWLGTRACALLLQIAESFSNFAFAAPSLPSISGVAAAVFMVGVLVFALSKRRQAWGLGAMACVVAWTLVAPRAHAPDLLTVTFLSVGHGDAIVIEQGRHAAIVDGGGVPGGTDVGARIVVPYLRERGISKFELAVLSHPHPDHALGLIRALEDVPTARLWLPAGNTEGPLTQSLRAAALPAPVETVEAGHAPFALGSAQIRVLGPPQERILLEDVNDRSVVLRLQHGDVSFLLTGDIEAAAEEVSMSGPVTVLKAPHHGSRTSSTEGFVARVRPRFVVFCVGRDNRFHFPNRNVVERYERVGSQCLRTDLDGAVRFVSDGRDVRLETFHPRADERRAGPVESSGARAQR